MWQSQVGQQVSETKRGGTQLILSTGSLPLKAGAVGCIVNSTLSMLRQKVVTTSRVLFRSSVFGKKNKLTANTE